MGATPGVPAVIPDAGAVALEGGGGACGGRGGAGAEAGPPAGATAGLMVELILADFGKRDGLTGPAETVAWWHRNDGVFRETTFQVDYAMTDSCIIALQIFLLHSKRLLHYSLKTLAKPLLRVGTL